MARWGMVIDLDRCVACQACTVACKAENNVPFAVPKHFTPGEGMFWNQVLRLIEGKYPNVKVRFLPRPCMHCENAPCVLVCPVQATYKDEEGLVRIDYDRCIGCKYCMVACPYGARYFNEHRPNSPQPMELYRNPDPEPQPRPGGVVEKCTFCVQRIRKAKEKARLEGRKLRDGDIAPACVQTCPARARYFGDLDDSDSTVYQLIKSPRAFRLREELGTHPKVYYLREA